MNVYVYCVDIIYILQETGGGGMGKGSHERENTLRLPPTFEIMIAPLPYRPITKKGGVGHVKQTEPNNC